MVTKIPTSNKKLTKWEAVVRDSVIKKERIRFERARRQREEKINKLKRYISIPITIGLIACFLFIIRFGITEFEKTIYSWLIGLTFISTIIASFWGTRKKKHH